MEGTSQTAPFQLPEIAPTPVSAVFDNSETAAYITFDQNLNPPGSSNTTTFTLHTVPRRYQAGAVTLPGPSQNVIRVAGINMVVVAGGGTIDYSNALNTLVGTNGLSVASFTGLPCPAQP